MKDLKMKKCKICKTEFPVFLSAQKVCSPECALKLAKIDIKKKEDKERRLEERIWRQKKSELKDTVPIWTKKTQQAFNEYIRLRDYSKPCISCGKHDHEITTNSVRGGKWDCGHYRSVGFFLSR